jgi:hypothetical protein
VACFWPLVARYFELCLYLYLGIWHYVDHACIGAKGNSYKELVYKGPNVFVGAAKLVHTSGYVSCRSSSRNSYWGCDSSKDLAITITDTSNRVLYPSPHLIKRGGAGWYEMPGYDGVSPELIFRDFCEPQYFKKGRKLRVWYGEDLHGHTEHDNHGKSCMHVYFYLLAH